MKNTLLPEFYIRFRRVFCFILTINCVKYSPPIEAGAEMYTNTNTKIDVYKTP